MTGTRPARGQSPFAARLQTHLEDWRVHVDGSRSRYWMHWTDGIFSAYRDLAEQVVHDDQVRLHKQAPHVRSSQAFAFNLSLPFREGHLDRLSELINQQVGTRLTIDKVQFEWVPPGGLLGEIAGDRPVGDEPATAADVVLWGQTGSRRRAAVLLEVKLSEGEFTPCGGRESRGNRRKDVCQSARLFMHEPNACYLRRPVRQRRDRRYWEIFSRSHGSVRNAFPNADLNGPCPFAYDMQQPMRNLAIAQGLVQDGALHQAWFALCAHDANPQIAALWADWSHLLPETSTAPTLPASSVVGVGESAGLKRWAAYMRERYQL